MPSAVGEDDLVPLGYGVCCSFGFFRVIHQLIQRCTFANRGAGAGVDSVLGQRKLEAMLRELLENAQHPITTQAHYVEDRVQALGGFLDFNKWIERNTILSCNVLLASQPVLYVPKNFLVRRGVKHIHQ